MEHISISQINMFYGCAEQWRRRYIEGDMIPPGIAAAVGTGVHSAGELDLVQKIESGVDLPVDVLTDAAAQGYEKKLSDGVFIPRESMSTAEKDLAAGLDQTVALTRVFAGEIAPRIQPALVEAKAYLDVDDMPIPFLGIIDCLTKDHRLSDLKTSKSKWSQAKADSELQPTLYRKLVKQMTGEEPREIAYDILVKTKTPQCQVLNTTRNDEDFDALKSRAKLMIAQISAGIFPPAEVGHWKCSPKWCGYYWTCAHIPAHLKVLPKKEGTQ